jgi:hypothetical protein
MKKILLIFFLSLFLTSCFSGPYDDINSVARSAVINKSTTITKNKDTIFFDGFKIYPKRNVHEDSHYVFEKNGTEFVLSEKDAKRIIPLMKKDLEKTILENQSKKDKLFSSLE